MFGFGLESCEGFPTVEDFLKFLAIIIGVFF